MYIYILYIFSHCSMNTGFGLRFLLALSNKRFLLRSMTCSSKTLTRISDVTFSVRLT